MVREEVRRFASRAVVIAIPLLAGTAAAMLLLDSTIRHTSPTVPGLGTQPVQRLALAPAAKKARRAAQPGAQAASTRPISTTVASRPAATTRVHQHAKPQRRTAPAGKPTPPAQPTTPTTTVPPPPSTTTPTEASSPPATTATPAQQPSFSTSRTAGNAQGDDSQGASPQAKDQSQGDQGRAAHDERHDSHGWRNHWQQGAHGSHCAHSLGRWSSSQQTPPNAQQSPGTQTPTHWHGHHQAQSPPPPHWPPPGHGPPGPMTLRGLLDFLNISQLTPVIRGPCQHARAEHRYRPSRRLRHLIRARNATCAAPGCGRRAASCDLDHTRPHHQGGRTCECNLAPLCRHHHRCKQAEGWRLEQPEPGVLVWRTPAGRTYTTTPTQYS